jgi:hypothetical protein
MKAKAKINAELGQIGFFWEPSGLPIGFLGWVLGPRSRPKMVLTKPSREEA